MSLIEFIQKLFLIPETKIKKSLKKIKNLDFLDTIWVKEEGVIFEGWVFDITRRGIIVVYGKDLRDFRFRTEKLLDKTEIIQDDKVLYCNEPDESYIKLS